MERRRGRVVHVESLEDFDERMAAGTTRLSGWRVHGLDLRGRGEQLRRCRSAGSLFLGCTFADTDAEHLRSGGALLLPPLASVPVDVYRSRLYRPEELYDDPVYPRSSDARAYAWSQQRHGPDDTLARALHDHAVDDALRHWVSDRRLVGVMGGHALARATPGYAEAARLGHLLGQDLVVATGGGPGAMEAAALGGYLGEEDAAAVTESVAALAAVPSYVPDVGAWVAAAEEVRARYGPGRDGLGIPTWHYGHEPSHVFASAVAKFFGNPAREAVLLEVCDAGIVFLPGAGGTVQEIFQDACENYYADESSVAPMVLVGRTHWTETLPAWPLLQQLSRGRAMEPHVHLVDSVEEAAELVRRRHQP